MQEDLNDADEEAHAPGLVGLVTLLLLLQLLDLLLLYTRHGSGGTLSSRL